MRDTLIERLEAYRDLCADCEKIKCFSKEKCERFYAYIGKKRREAGKE